MLSEVFISFYFEEKKSHTLCYENFYSLNIADIRKRGGNKSYKKTYKIYVTLYIRTCIINKINNKTIFIYNQAYAFVIE